LQTIINFYKIIRPSMKNIGSTTYIFHIGLSFATLVFKIAHFKIVEVAGSHYSTEVIKNRTS